MGETGTGFRGGRGALQSESSCAYEEGWKV